MFQKGYLPHAGGMLDQHCMFPDIMRGMQYAFNETDRVLRENEANKNKNK